VHTAIVQALEAEKRFNTLLNEGGPLVELAEYHTAKLAPLTESLDALRAGMEEIKTSMEQLNKAVPGLFPGVEESEVVK